MIVFGFFLRGFLIVLCLYLQLCLGMYFHCAGAVFGVPTLLFVGYLLKIDPY